eukprot:663960-Pyramimonas_sp.AAC.1
MGPYPVTSPAERSAKLVGVHTPPPISTRLARGSGEKRVPVTVIEAEDWSAAQVAVAVNTRAVAAIEYSKSQVWVVPASHPATMPLVVASTCGGANRLRGKSIYLEGGPID